MIARGHDDANAGALAARDSFGHFPARRIHHPRQADEDQTGLVHVAVFQRFLVGVHFIRRDDLIGRRQHPQGLACHAMIFLCDKLPILLGYLSGLAVLHDLRAPFYNRLRRALDVDPDLPLLSLVEGGHKFGIGAKGQLVDPVHPRFQVLFVISGLRRRHDERALSGIAANLPGRLALLMLVLDEPGVVAERADL